MFITFLSDFGLVDDFVGTCHAVMKRIAPDAQIIDLTHGIRPQQVLQGALVLANTVPYAPVGVHLAIVDPGVGSSRRALALEAGEGRRFVGPDNGLLLPAADRLGAIRAAHELTNPDLELKVYDPNAKLIPEYRKTPPPGSIPRDWIGTSCVTSMSLPCGSQSGSGSLRGVRPNSRN